MKLLLLLQVMNHTLMLYQISSILSDNTSSIAFTGKIVQKYMRIFMLRILESSIAIYLVWFWWIMPHILICFSLKMEFRYFLITMDKIMNLYYFKNIFKSYQRYKMLESIIKKHFNFINIVTFQILKSQYSIYTLKAIIDCFLILFNYLLEI